MKDAPIHILVVVSGTPGSGKTKMMKAIASLLVMAGHTVTAIDEETIREVAGLGNIAKEKLFDSISTHLQTLGRRHFTIATKNLKNNPKRRNRKI